MSTHADEYSHSQHNNQEQRANQHGNNLLSEAGNLIEKPPAMLQILNSSGTKPKIEYYVEEVKEAVGETRFFGMIVALSLFCIGFHFFGASTWALGPNYTIDLQMNPDKLNGMHAAQSFALIFSALMGALLVGKYVGAAESLCFGILVAFSGAISTAFGVTFNLYHLILAGRFLIGIFYEMLNVAQYVITCNMFSDYYLNTMFTLQFGFLKMGGGVAFLIVPLIYHAIFMKLGLAGPYQLGLTTFILIIPIVICDLPSACTICTTYRRFKKKVKNPPNEKTRPSIKKTCIENLTNLEAAQVLIMVCAMIYKPVIESYIIQLSQLIINKNEISWQKSLAVISTFDFAQGLLGPFIGMILDWQSNNHEMVILSALLALSAFVMQNFTYMYITPIVLLSIGYTIFISSYWLIIARSKTNDQSFNLGIGLMLLGLSRTFFYYVTGVLLKKYGFYLLNSIYINLMIAVFTISFVAQRFAVKNK